jgi:hypothetical protein
MPIRLSPVLSAITLSCALSAGAGLWATSADAQSPAKQCADQWKSAKAGGSVPAGQKRADYIKECRDRLAGQPAGGVVTPPIGQPSPGNPLKPAATTTAAPAASPSTAAPAASPSTAAAPEAGAKPKKPMSPGMAAFHEREKKCGEEWRTNTDQIKAQTPGITWPKYLSACNKRLKAAGQ